jgi:hypothetical protein
MENKIKSIVSQHENTLLALPSSTNLSGLNNTYIHLATSHNTRKAYQSDVRHYETWEGKLPATPEMIARYLEEHAAKLNHRKKIGCY